MVDTKIALGTFECPYCGFDEVHGHHTPGPFRWFQEHKKAFESHVIGTQIAQGCSMQHYSEQKRIWQGRFQEIYRSGNQFCYRDQQVEKLWQLWQYATLHCYKQYPPEIPISKGDKP